MSDERDTILIIDDESGVRTLLREQVFYAPNFDVIEAKDGPDTLRLLKDHQPNLIVMDLGLPGLTGLDMLVAIKAQGFTGPIIVMEDRGERRSAVEAFRLGATDYVTKPIREPEVLAAVERGLAEVRLRRQRNDLMTRLKATNTQLEARVRELTTLYEIGESITAIRNLDDLFDRVLDGALTMTGADQAMVLWRDDKSSQLVLRAGKNLPLAMLDRMGEPLPNQLAELVTTSREAMAVSGDSLRQFALSRDLYAAAYVPMTVQNAAIGVLAVSNQHTLAAFDDNHTRLLKTLADYAAIVIVNARLFNVLEQRARSMETIAAREAERGRQVQAILSRLYQPLLAVEADLKRLAEGEAGKPPKELVKRLVALRRQVHQLAIQIVNARESRPKDKQL